jgi:hypothetical protein
LVLASELLSGKELCWDDELFEEAGELLEPSEEEIVVPALDFEVPSLPDVELVVELACDVEEPSEVVSELATEDPVESSDDSLSEIAEELLASDELSLWLLSDVLLDEESAVDE